MAKQNLVDNRNPNAVTTPRPKPKPNLIPGGHGVAPHQVTPRPNQVKPKPRPAYGSHAGYVMGPSGKYQELLNARNGRTALASSFKRPASHSPGTGGAAPTHQPSPAILTGGQGFGEMGEAYDYHKGSLKGFARDPQSPTGWSFIDEFGRVGQSRAPIGAERDRILTRQALMSANPYFYDKGRGAGARQPGFSAPWLQGFKPGTGGWLQMQGGGYFNPQTWTSWKPGDPIPPQGATPSASGGGLPATEDIYTSLLRAFGAL